jgi:hypothetical protein
LQPTITKRNTTLYFTSTNFMATGSPILAYARHEQRHLTVSNLPTR